MLPFGVTILATVPQGSEIPEGLRNKPVFAFFYFKLLHGLMLLNNKSQFKLKKFLLFCWVKFQEA